MPARGGNAVWIDVLPSLVGFGAELAKQAIGGSRRAGQAMATQLERVAKDAGKAAGEALAAGVEDAKDRVKDAADDMTKAHDKVADAAGRVTVAEAKLTDARKKYTETSAQVITAQERLSAATRAHTAAERGATRAVAEHDQATAHLTESQRRQTEETARTESAIANMVRSMSKVDTKRIDSGSKSMAKFSAAAYASAAGIAAIGSSLPAIAGIAGIFAQASGAALILPGALVAGGVAAGTLKLGLSGVGAALKEWDDAEKFAEKIKELSTNARGFAVEVRALRPELIGLRNVVQDRLFAGASDDVKALGQTYIPVLRKELADVSGEFGLARQSLVSFAVQGNTVRDVTSILNLTEQQVHNVRGAVAPLAAAFLDMSVVGGEALARMTSGLEGSAVGFAAFISNARETGQIEQWINAGMQALRDLGELFGNISAIISTVLGAANREGGSFLDTLNAVTGSVVAMLQSAQGQEALSTFFRTVHDTVQALLPGLRSVGGAVLDGIIKLGPQIPPVARAFSDVAISLAPLIPDLVSLAVSILPPIVSLVRELAPAAGTLAAAWLGGYAALLLFNGAVAFFNGIRWIIGFYKAWAAGQIALNIAMTANPVGIIVAAIGALIAAIIYLWNNNEGFRNFFINAWASIRAAVMTAWDQHIKPAFTAIVTAVKAVGDAAVWLWQNAIVPAAEAIGAAASWLWHNVLEPFFGFMFDATRLVAVVITTLFVAPIVIAFNLLSALALWLWQNGIRPAFEGIAAVATWLWRTVMEPFVALHVAAFRTIASLAQWFYDAVIKPVFDAIGFVVGWVIGQVVAEFNKWVAIVQVAYLAIQVALAAIGDFFTWLWDNKILPFVNFVVSKLEFLGLCFQILWTGYVQPALQSIGDFLSWVWDNTIGRVFSLISSGVEGVGGAFESAVGFIERVWGGLREILAKPVNFVIQTVYNDGIRAVWNKVADFVGIDGLPAMDPITFAGGGVLPGYAPGRDIVPALLSPGEAVLVPEAVRLIGARNILALNASVSGRRGNTGGNGYSGGGVVQRFAGGGVVGSLLNWVSGIGDSVAKLWADPAAFIKAQLGSSGWLDLLARGPAKLIEQGAEWLWEKIKGFFSFSSDAAASAAGAAGGVPVGWQQMWAIISAQFPGATLNSSYRPGDPGYHGKGRAIDIGGPMGAINSWIAQVYPNSTQLIYTPGVNILNGRPFTYDAPTQADHYDHVHWAFDHGGYLMPGMSTVYNGTGKPEPVLTGEQWKALSSNNIGNGEPVQIVGTLAVANDGLSVLINGRIEAANQATGTAAMSRRR